MLRRAHYLIVAHCTDVTHVYGMPAIGGLIDRLEKSDLMRREVDAADRRMNRIFLLPKTKQLIARMRKVSRA
jgi:DNA-binding MarR family transcriptional regulator